MQVMPMQPLLLHSHPLQLCRLSMHGLQLVGSRHLGNCALKLSWIRSSYLKSAKMIRMDSLDSGTLSEPDRERHLIRTKQWVAQHLVIVRKIAE